jgi:hypothetical protein
MQRVFHPVEHAPDVSGITMHMPAVVEAASSPKTPAAAASIMSVVVVVGFVLDVLNQFFQVVEFAVQLLEVFLHVMHVPFLVSGLVQMPSEVVHLGRIAHQVAITRRVLVMVFELVIQGGRLLLELQSQRVNVFE